MTREEKLEWIRDIVEKTKDDDTTALVSSHYKANGDLSITIGSKYSITLDRLFDEVVKNVGTIDDRHLWTFIVKDDEEESLGRLYGKLKTFMEEFEADLEKVRAKNDEY